MRGLRWMAVAAAVALLIAYASARRPGGIVSESRFLMDTLVTVTLWGMPEPDARGALDGAFEAMERVDREMARRPDTPLGELNREGRARVSESMYAVVASAVGWARRTAGAFDPTVAPLLDLWDIPSGPHPPPSPGALAEVLGRTGWHRVRLDEEGRWVDLGGTEIDLGGIAKGYAIDRAVEALRSAGARDFLVDAGGDLYLAGTKGGRPWRIAIQHPRADRYLRIVEPLEGALVTSGDYERFFEWDGQRFHHILDPRTGEPARGCQSVTVWAPAAVDADALATAVFVLGPEEGLRLLEREPGVEGLIVASDGTVLETPGFARVAPEGTGR